MWVSGQLQAQADLPSGKSSRFSTEQDANLVADKQLPKHLTQKDVATSGRPTGLWRYSRRRKEETFTFKVLVSGFLHPFIPLNQFMSA
jgi:hypothetical protein